MGNAVIASGSLVLMLLLIWGGLHVAVVLGLVSVIWRTPAVGSRPAA